MVETIEDPDAMRRRSRAARRAGLTVGLVPTMGSLHAGHASLLRRARQECGLAVASIFVNPAQFGPGEDFERYPRDLDRDRALLERLEIDVLFHPDASVLYRPQPRHRTWVDVEGMSHVLCGASRPGHFRGVTTVVLKLLNIVEPDIAYMGQKDAQQAIIIDTMVRDLNVGTRIEVCPTVREADGLALSSRNSYLTPPERAAAPVIHRALCAARDALASGERSPAVLLEQVRGVLASEPLIVPEYVQLVNPIDLEPLTSAPLRGEGLLAVAVRIGTTRLIDNITLSVEETGCRTGPRRTSHPC
ncbi:MAG: pantoate--beta-alanine ligase [Acidobacteriota bacterium]